MRSDDIETSDGDWRARRVDRRVTQLEAAVDERIDALESRVTQLEGERAAGDAAYHVEPITDFPPPVDQRSER